MTLSGQIGLFVGLGGRCGTLRRLKVVTTSKGESRSSVGCAKDHRYDVWWATDGKRGERQLTPSRRVGVIDGGVNVTKIIFTHETIILSKMGNEDEEQDLLR